MQRIKQEKRYRIFIDLQHKADAFPRARHQNKHDVIIWCSNDYLAQGHEPHVIQAMQDALRNYGGGSGGTRNISGTTDLHVQLEKRLARLHNKQAALLFTSGYVANETTLATLGQSHPHWAFISDAANHASMIHGMRAAKAEKHIFQHNDTDHLEAILATMPSDKPKMIVCESVYSMDGDFAPLKAITQLAQRYHALVYTDEVHAVGIYGTNGGGGAEKEGVMDAIDIVQGTLAKAFGVMGGYIAGNAQIIDFIRSTAPAFIFTTSLPPTVVAGALKALDHIRDNPHLRTRMLDKAQRMKKNLKQAGIPMLASPSHIIPIIIGDPSLCTQASQMLLEKGHYVQPVNYPTVPKKTERLRLTLTPKHTNAMIDDFTHAITHVWKTIGRHLKE
ncbi:MAG: 5-aminolevulinate synthase [Alphaproteobacteria bacterium GM202ARS2]|nr:5-aminolevulinate synthase [Alphaproteobacteria bacterium GM202ARS2]